MDQETIPATLSNTQANLFIISRINIKIVPKNDSGKMKEELNVFMH